NRIVQHRPLSLTDELELRVSASPFRPHHRGRVFDFVGEAYVDGELVWEDVSTNLKKGAAEGEREEHEFEEPPVTAHCRLPEYLRRRYAAVSGDHIPIHLHALTAKALGFPRAIAHGMWGKARCLAALQLPDAFTVEARFRKPVLLPSHVTFGE